MLKMITGEMVVAETTTNNEVAILKNPMALIPTPHGDIGMTSWLMLSDDNEVTIDRDHIISISNPIDDIVNGYKQKFGGIIMPSHSPLSNIKI